MNITHKKVSKLSPIWQVIVEVGFIVFLYYSNLLMGEFVRSKSHGKSLAVALYDIFTLINFTIAIVSALIAYLTFGYLRRKI